MNNLYTTVAMIALIAEVRMPHKAIADVFFKREHFSKTAKVAMDIRDDKRRLAPYCSPIIEGKIVESKGFRTDEIAVPYIKDKRAVDPERPLSRLAGETYGGDQAEDPGSRMDAIVLNEMLDQGEMIILRQEEQAASAMLTGKVIVTGDGYDSVEINFGRDAELTKSLTGAAAWDQGGVSPFADVKAWRRLVLAKSGEKVTDIFFGPDAWDLFADDPKTKEAISTELRGGASEIELIDNVGEGAEYQGRLGAAGPRLWIYSQSYVDEMGVEQELFPADGVIMGSDNERSTGIQAFGAIRDDEAGYQSMRIYPKSWVPKDPAILHVMAQSAPLMVPSRVNSTFGATVLD